MTPTPNWREGLPLLLTTSVVLRELRRSDAEALVRVARSADVARYAPPQPTRVDEFEDYINAAWRLRGEGRAAIFAVVPKDALEPAGLFELRSLQPGFVRAELGVVLEPLLWDGPVFDDGLRLVCEFAFATVGVRRIEIRSVVSHSRANAALARLGVQREAVLREAFPRGNIFEDQCLWSIVHGLDRLAD